MFECMMCTAKGTTLCLESRSGFTAPHRKRSRLQNRTVYSTALYARLRKLEFFSIVCVCMSEWLVG